MKNIWGPIIAASILVLAACGKDHNNAPVVQPPAAATLLATGGSSGSGSGGAGGYVRLESYGGAVKVLKSGTVDASFVVSSVTPSFGSNPYVVSGGTTTVLLDSNAVQGQLCAASGDPNLYVATNSGACGTGAGDTAVTGLSVDAGATLVLVDQGYWGGYGTAWLSNDLVINGTITSNALSVYLEANIIDVENSGKITTSATTTDTAAGQIYLGCGMYGCGGNSSTNEIINRGTIEAKGLGTGDGGYLFFEPNDLVANYGTVDASGGDSDTGSGNPGGVSGALDVFVDYGDFYSSGIVRVNGGKGASGGSNEADVCNVSYYCDSISVETALYGNTARNGDIIISGIWEANGGEGTAGDGGYGGYILLQTDATGTVIVNANMSVKGGDSTGTSPYSGSGASTYGIDIYQSFDPYGYGLTLPAVAGKVSIGGTYDLRGGIGDAGGGNGGYFEVYANNSNQDITGADIGLVRFGTVQLNGGEGTSGGGTSSQAFEIYTYNTASYPAGPITNEANIEAKGGRATAGSNWGGGGGYVEMITYGIGDPAETVTNSGSVDVSGGDGDNGGSSNAVNLQAQHVSNSGNLAANGGNGSTAGGNGGSITLTSNDVTTPTNNTGALSAAGGTPSGGAGTKTIDGTIIP